MKDPTLRWQDTFSEAPDGTIFLMTSHIQDLAYFKQGAPVALFTELWSFKPQQVLRWREACPWAFCAAASASARR